MFQSSTFFFLDFGETTMPKKVDDDALGNPLSLFPACFSFFPACFPFFDLGGFANSTDSKPSPAAEGVGPNKQAHPHL